MAEELPPLIGQLVGDASDLYSTLTQVESVLSAFADKDYTAQLGVNWAPVEAGIQQANAALDAFASDGTSAVLGVDTAEALAELAAFLSVADSTVITIPVKLDTGGAYAQLAALNAAAGVGGGTGTGVSGGNAADPAAIAALLAASRTTAGSRGISSLYGIPAGAAAAGGGGGGGNGGLLAALGFGGAGGRFGLGALAGLGTLGSLAGGGAESVLTTGAGILGSGAGALLGGGAIAAGTLGVGAVGMGTDLAGIGQAAGDIKGTVQAMNALNQAIAVYGPKSTEAATAQAQLNYQLNSFSPAARGAVVAAAQTAQGFKTMFDQVTGAAEATGANIINQVMQVAEKFLPTIGKFAAENMNIIQASLQPLFTWLQGPGLQIFTQLEQKFQSELPQAMQAFDQGIELLIRTLGFLAPYTGRIITDLDNLFTRLNGDDWGKYTHAISDAIGIFRDWEGLIKAVGTAIYELFTHDAGTGTALVVKLTDLINKFNDWAKTTAGGDSLHALLVSHRDELMNIIDVLGHLISAWGQVELTVRPFIMDLVDGLAKVLNFLFEIPGVGQLMGLAFAFEILGSRIGFLGGLLSSFNNMLKSLVLDGVHLLGSAVLALASSTSGYFSTWLSSLGGWLQGVGVAAPTAAETAATAMQGAAESMAASAAQISEAMTGITAASDTMATDVSAATAGPDSALSILAEDAMASAVTFDEAMGMMGVAAEGMATKVDASTAAADAAFGTEAADATASAATVDVALSSEGGAGIAGGTAAVAGGAAIGGTEVAGGAAVAGTAAITSTATIVAAAVASAVPLALGILGLIKTSGQTSSLTYPQAVARENQNPQGSVGLGGLVSPINLSQPITNPNFGGLPVKGGVLQLPNATDAAQAAVSPDYATNVAELSKATGLAQANVIALAGALKVNLNNAMDPGTIETFTNYVKNNGGAAGVTGSQWKTASENIQVALQAMASKAATAMPNVSGAVRNMVTATQPALIDLVGKLNKSGKDGVAAYISQFVAGLSPAQLASKQMHDGIFSPLYPLEQELRQIGQTGPANMIAAFIAQKGGATSAAGQMHDAFKNPLYSLQTELAADGKIGASGLIQAFIEKHPEAATQAGLMHDAITGALSPLLTGLQAIGQGATANFIAAVASQAGGAHDAGAALGAAVDSGLASGITSSNGVVINAVNGIVQSVISAGKTGLKAASPSKRIAEEWGLPVAQGFAVGMLDNAHLATGAASHLVGGVIGAPSAITGGAIAPVVASSSAGSGTPQIIQLTSNTNVDGRTIASTVTNYQLKGGRSTGNVLGQYAGGTQQQTSVGISTNAVPR